MNRHRQRHSSTDNFKLKISKMNLYTELIPKLILCMMVESTNTSTKPRLKKCWYRLFWVAHVTALSHNLLKELHQLLCNICNKKHIYGESDKLVKHFEGRFSTYNTNSLYINRRNLGADIVANQKIHDDIQNQFLFYLKSSLALHLKSHKN